MTSVFIFLPTAEVFTKHKHCIRFEKEINNIVQSQMMPMMKKRRMLLKNFDRTGNL